MVSLQELTAVLTQALSQEQAHVKQAEAHLGSYETQPGYHHALATVFCNADNPQEVRWMAIVCIKNGTNKYWRKNAPGGISESEKPAIKEALLQAVATDLPKQLSLQLALVLSKISRFDFPVEWPGLVPFLMSHLDSPYGYQSSVTLYYVIKTLTTKRILSDRHVFYDLSIQMYEPMVTYWKATTQAFLANNADVIMLERSLYFLKSIKLLLLHGSKNGLEQKLALCFEDLFNWLLTMLKCRAHYSQAGPLATVLTKWCLQCTKVLLEIQSQHTTAYIPYVKGSFNLALQFAFNQDWRSVMFERCLVNSFNLLKSCLTEPTYRGPSKLSNEKEEVSQTDLVEEFFTDDIVQEFIQRLIFDFFPVTTTELEQWQADPEEYATEQGGDLWKFSWRPCVESLFVSFASTFKEIAIGEIKGLVSQVAPLQTEPTFEEAQRRQAIYTATSAVAYLSYDDIDYDSWFVQVLIPELKVNHKNYVIVHRAILELLHHISDVKFSDNLRPLLYETLAAFLDPEYDLVVRLEACRTTKKVVDNFQFNAEQFVPYLGRTMMGQFKLLSDLTECQGKIVVLQTTTLILECMGESCLPYVGEVASFIPPLWDQSAEHNLLRAAIVGVLTKTVIFMEAQSVVLYPLTLKIIAHSVNTNEPQHVFLLEDALDLWRAVLEQSPVEHDDLLTLAKFICPIFELGSEFLEGISIVTKLYIVLFKTRFLSLEPEKLAAVILSSMKELNVQGCTFMMKVVEMAIKVAPAESFQLFYAVIPYALDEIMSESFPKEYTNVSFSVISRMLLFAEPAALQLLAEKAVSKQSTPEAEMRIFLEKCVQKVPNVRVIQTQKIMAIALLQLLVNHWSPVMYEKICAIALVVCEVLNDIMMEENANGIHFIDSLLVSPESTTVNSEIDFDQSRHSDRMFELIKTDPAHTIMMTDFLIHQMDALAKKIGPLFTEVIQEIDCETRDTLEMYTRTGIFAKPA